MPILYINTVVAIFIFMSIVWLISLALRNSSIVDIFWGLGFVLIVWLVYFSLNEIFLTTSAASTASSAGRGVLLVILVSLWGLRLGLHIGRRNWGQPEDFRYAKWRAENGPRWWWVSFFKVFLLQGILLWVIAVPIITGQLPAFRGFPRPLDWVGLAVWAFGFYFESIGDWQLVRFKADSANRGKLLTTGLWRFTRHPNYFGDAAQWWGFWLIASAAGAWWTIFSPLLMTFLLMRVSGVKMLEESLKKTKLGYEEYVLRTNEFFPWPPK